MSSERTTRSAGEPDREDELARLKRQAAFLTETLSKYRALAEAVQSARVVDFGIYGEFSEQAGPGWLWIDRDDYEKMMEHLSGLDLWRPWHDVIQRRIGPL